MQLTYVDIVVPYTEGVQGVCAVEGSPCACRAAWWCEACYVLWRVVLVLAVLPGGVRPAMCCGGLSLCLPCSQVV